MTINEKYYVIASISTPTTYEADTRVKKLVANDKNQFYRLGDTVTKIEDAYKWESEEDANNFLTSHIKQLEGYEVRPLRVTYELD